MARARDRRRGEAAEHDDPEPVGNHRHDSGEHDARLWMAAPGHGSTNRTNAVCRAVDSRCHDTWRAGRERCAQPVARTGRQHHDLSLALQGDSTIGSGTRPRDGGREQPAVVDLSDQRDRGASRSDAARTGVRADQRRAEDRDQLVGRTAIVRREEAFHRPQPHRKADSSRSRIDADWSWAPTNSPT